MSVRNTLHAELRHTVREIRYGHSHAPRQAPSKPKATHVMPDIDQVVTNHFGQAPGVEDLVIDQEGSESFLCQICLGLMRDPVVTSCGHTYCRQCIRQEFKSRQRCPMDRINLGGNAPLFANRLVADLISKLQLRCPMGVQYDTKKHMWVASDDGCQEVFPLSRYEYHIAHCKHRPVLCNTCCQLVAKGDLAQHELTCDYEPEPEPPAPLDDHSQPAALDTDNAAKADPHGFSRCFYCYSLFPDNALAQHERSCDYEAPPSIDMDDIDDGINDNNEDDDEEDEEEEEEEITIKIEETTSSSSSSSNNSSTSSNTTHNDGTERLSDTEKETASGGKGRSRTHSFMRFFSRKSKSSNNGHSSTTITITSKSTRSTSRKRGKTTGSGIPPAPPLPSHW